MVKCLRHPAWPPSARAATAAQALDGGQKHLYCLACSRVHDSQGAMNIEGGPFSAIENGPYRPPVTPPRMCGWSTSSAIQLFAIGVHGGEAQTPRRTTVVDSTGATAAFWKGDKPEFQGSGAADRRRGAAGLEWCSPDDRGWGCGCEEPCSIFLPIPTDPLIRWRSGGLSMTQPQPIYTGRGCSVQGRAPFPLPRATLPPHPAGRPGSGSWRRIRVEGHTNPVRGGAPRPDFSSIQGVVPYASPRPPL